MIQVRPTIRENGPDHGDACPKLTGFVKMINSHTLPQEEYHRFGLVGPGAAPAADEPPAPELEHDQPEGADR